MFPYPSLSPNKYLQRPMPRKKRSQTGSKHQKKKAEVVVDSDDEAVVIRSKPKTKGSSKKSSGESEVSPNDSENRPASKPKKPARKEPKPPAKTLASVEEDEESSTPKAKAKNAPKQSRTKGKQRITVAIDPEDANSYSVVVWNPFSSKQKQL